MNTGHGHSIGLQHACTPMKWLTKYKVCIFVEISKINDFMSCNSPFFKSMCDHMTILDEKN